MREQLRRHGLRNRGVVLGRGGRNRQVDGERRALAFHRADRETAFHPANELTADVQAKAGAADAAGEAGVDAVELAEDPALLERSDPDPFVADADPDAALARLDRKFDTAPAGRVLDGVVDQVDQDLAQLVRISGYGLERVGDLELDRDVLSRGEEGAHLTRDALRERAKIDLLFRQRELSRIEVAGVEDVVRGPGEAFGLLGDHVEEPLLVGFAELDVFTQQGLGRAVDRCQWRAKLVRNGG